MANLGNETNWHQRRWYLERGTSLFCFRLAAAVPARCIINASVMTMTRPTDQADAICWDDDGSILAVGNNKHVLTIAQKHDIPVEDIAGKIVLPGFVDAHMHFLHVGVRRMRPDLRGANSLAEVEHVVAQWLANNPGTEPVIAEGWDESAWPNPVFPSKTDVDRMAGDRPFVLRRMCGHFAIANSAALSTVRNHWNDPELVDMETGVLREQPSLYLNEVFPVDPAGLQAALKVATDEAHSLGVTCVGEYTQAPFRTALLEAATNGTLRIRIANHIYVQQLDSEIKSDFRTGTPRNDGNLTVERFRDGGLKVFLDGSFGGRTAWLREPYQDDEENPDNLGTPIWSDEDCLDWFRRAHDAGIQVTAHAIGDAAIDQALRCFEAVLGQDSGGQTKRESTGSQTFPPALRHRIEHYELPQPDAVEATIRLGITACAQPNFLGEWSAKGGMYERRIGPAFLLNNRYRTYLDAGMSLCFGSDGMPFGPLIGIHAAVNHPVPEERLSPQEALWLYTNRAAWACHWDDQVGTLEAGKRADLLILNHLEIAATPPKDWIIEETVFDGNTVWRNGDAVAA